MRCLCIGWMSVMAFLQGGVPIFCLLATTTNAFTQAPLCQRSRVHSSSSRLLSATDSRSTAATSPNNSGSNSLFQRTENVVSRQQISKLSAVLSKAGMIAFIISMCLTLPFALIPPNLLYRLRLISKVRQQQMALSNGQFCARQLLRIFPFCKVTTIRSTSQDDDPQPSIWVCNHTSALDVFILLAKDLELRGKNKRPIKIVYVRI